MPRFLRTLFSGFDGILFLSLMSLAFFGLATMYSHVGENAYFNRQLVWVCFSTLLFFLAIVPDYRFLRTGNAAFFAYLGIILLLIGVAFFGEDVMGARQRFDLGFFSLQVSDPAKLVLIALLAKYFAKRHELIGDFKHVVVSGLYTLGIFGLVFLQPDFGSAMIIFLIWFGMVLVAGIKFRHVAVVFLLGAITLTALWQYTFYDYQKTRIMTFMDPLSDIRGAGYNAYQSTVAVGSGEIFGKGIGYGTQSKLQFLQEYETDFIFAAYAEEWGLIGVLLLFGLFSVLIIRILAASLHAADNFDMLFGTGIAIYFTAQFVVHVGMNMGLLPSPVPRCRL